MPGPRPTAQSPVQARTCNAIGVRRLSSFTHLHVHTEFSMLDGASRLDELVAAAAADGQPALGMTDHGNMYGTLDFYRACHDQGIKPIIGTEAYMAHESRHERPSRRGRVDDSGGETDGGKKLYYHLTLLAENNAGYKNLIQIASRAFMEGYYYKPRVDWEVLDDHSDGVIATTGCLGGHVLQALLRGDPEGAYERAGRLQDIFGRDNLFVELQDHGIPEQTRTNPELLEHRQEAGRAVVGDQRQPLHQPARPRVPRRPALRANRLVDERSRSLQVHGDQHYLKSAYEMRQLFRDVEVACDNSLWIAERSNVEIEFGKPSLPNFTLPPGFENDDDYLRHLTLEGARRALGRHVARRSGRSSDL